MESEQINMHYPKIEMPKLKLKANLTSEDRSARPPLHFPLLNMWKEAEPTPYTAATTNAIKPYTSGSADFLLHLIFVFARGVFTMGLLSWCMHWSRKNNIFMMLQSQVIRFLRGKCRRKEVCWGDLPQDLLAEIAKRLDGRIDILRFRSACKQWRSSLPAPNRFPLRVPPPPSVHPNYSNTAFFITEVDVYCVPNWRFWLVFQEVEQRDEFQTCRTNRCMPEIIYRKVSFMEPTKNAFYCCSILSKAYHIRTGFPRFNSRQERVEGKWDFKYNNRTVRTVIISSNSNGVNPSYARMSDLSVVAHLKGGSLNGRLALLRLGGPDASWDTNFCTRVFKAIATYRGKLCALDKNGRLFVMDYNSLQMTQITRASSIVKELYEINLVEVCGELIIVDMSLKSHARVVILKLSMRLQKWLELCPSDKRIGAVMGLRIK